MHIPYEEVRKHIADFKVKYRFYSEEEGGRWNLPYQGYRSDFKYDHFLHDANNQLFMIHPEFEDKDGNVILNDKESIPVYGTAKCGF